MNQFVNDFFRKYIFLYLDDFRLIKIYKYELSNIDNFIALSSNYKSIYSALDKVDFRLVRNNVRLLNVIKLIFKKMGFSDLEINSKDLDISILINNQKYSILFFSIGELPYINISYSNTIVIFYVNDFSKIYFCGIKSCFKKDDYIFYNDKIVLSNFKDFKPLP